MRWLSSFIWILSAVLCLACNTALVPADAKEPDAAKSSALSMFGGTPSRNLANVTDKGILDDFAVVPKGKQKNVAWSAALGTKAYAGPVIAGGKIYVGTNNEKPRDPAIKGDRSVLMCFNEADGKFLWQHIYEKGDEIHDSRQDGICSAPCVEGDRLWYVNNHAVFICSDTSGKVVWKYDMVKELDIFVCQQVYTSPLVVGDLVYAMTCNGVDAGTGKLPSPKAPSLIALNKKTGKLVWKNGLPGDKVMRGQWTNPSAATVNGKTQVIYGGGDGWLYGLEAKKGDLLWKFDCNPKAAKPYKPGGAGERSFIIGTPVIYENRCYIAVGEEPDDGPGVGHLWCVDITKTPKNKDKDLSPVGDNFDPKAKVNADSGLVWHYGGPVVPKPKDDDARDVIFGRSLSTVAIHDGLVYATELIGYLHCIDARTGVKYWEHDFQDSSWSSPYYVDGKVYFGVKGGDLFIFKAGKKYAAPKKIKIGSAIDVPVLAANGVLYVNSGSALFAIKK